MRNVYFLSFAFLFLVGCSSYRKAEKEIVYGDYDQAIDVLIDKRSKNVKEKDFETWVSLLQQSYSKANEESLSNIARASKEVESADKYYDLYSNYLCLDERQSKIKALLPIYHNDKKVLFEIRDYSSEITDYRKKYIMALAEEAQNKLESNNKLSARQAFNIYNRIEELMPNFPNLNNLRNQAKIKGTTQVGVFLDNQTQAYLPYTLERELVDNSYVGSNKFWYEFINISDPSIQMDYNIEMIFTRIEVGPNVIDRNTQNYEKEIVDGWEYQRNSDGSYMLDSLGQKIKVDKRIRVQASVTEISQTKETFMRAKVVLKEKNKILSTIPLDSHYIFSDLSADIRGDRRAIDNDYLDRVKRNPLPFPSTEQMIYDSGLDLKIKLNEYLNDVF